jgi:hypothetical protein
MLHDDPRWLVYDAGMTRTSYLRMYQPLRVFSESEQATWRALSEDITPGEPLAGSWLGGAMTPSTVDPSAFEGAFIRRVDGATLVCPWRTRLRMLAGLLEFRNSVPREVADAFVPENEARRAANELEAMDARIGMQSHMLHANWHVPLRWFTGFADLDRVLVEDRYGVRIRYEAHLADVSDRLAHAIGVFERSQIDVSITGLVRELKDWFEGFDPEGLVELDYGSVARSFSDDDLVDDHSAGDLWACINALETDDPVGAAEVFAALTDRWSAARVHEIVN